MEWLWRPFYKHLGKTTEIFTHTMFDSYCPPHGFNFDRYGYDEPFIYDEMFGHEV